MVNSLGEGLYYNNEAKKRELSEYFIAVIFILPSLLLFILFVFIPIVKTGYLSFFSWDGYQPVKEYIGLENYGSAFHEPQFIRAVINNVIWMAMHMIFACGTGLFLAFNLVRVQVFRRFFRTVLFLPNVIALSVSAVIWSMMYNPTFGIINGFLNLIGLSTLTRIWLGDPNIAIYSISIASSWQAFGYYTILFVAGLQNIDVSLYEAAKIDGANAWKQFLNVTLPGLKNVLTFILSISIINGLKGFATVWTMTQGGPEYSTMLMTLYIFKKAFTENNFGLASAGGVILGLIIVLVTIIFNKVRDTANEQ